MGGAASVITLIITLIHNDVKYHKVGAGHKHGDNASPLLPRHFKKNVLSHSPNYS